MECGADLKAVDDVIHAARTAGLFGCRLTDGVILLILALNYLLDWGNSFVFSGREWSNLYV